MNVLFLIAPIFLFNYVRISLISDLTLILSYDCSKLLCVTLNIDFSNIVLSGFNLPIKENYWLPSLTYDEFQDYTSWRVLL